MSSCFVVVNPEERSLLNTSAVVVSAMQDRADGRHSCAELCHCAVVVHHLLDKVRFYLFIREVSIVHTEASVAFFIIDAMTIHELLCSDYVIFHKVLIAIQLIVVGLHLTAQNKFEEVVEKVLTSVSSNRCRKVKHSICILRKIQFTENITAPSDILRHCGSYGKLSV